MSRIGKRSVAILAALGVAIGIVSPGAGAVPLRLELTPELLQLQALVTTAQGKLDNPAPGTSWAVERLDPALYSFGGAQPAELTNDTTVSDLEDAIVTAQNLIDLESANTSAITAARNTLTTRTSNLRRIIHYSSFTGADGVMTYDTNGIRIQAHGGQVTYIPKSATGEDTDVWFWVGEERANSGGFALYSSADLYNWNFRGVVMRRIKTADVSKLSNPADPYFYPLYGALSQADKDRVVTGIGQSAVLERPKLMYNASTEKFILWFHADGRTPTDSNSYATAAAGYAISDTIDGAYRYEDRWRLHQMADSEYTGWNTYPFIGRLYGTNNRDAGPYWYEHPKYRGFARDMTTFVDQGVDANEDGVDDGYIIYSSEENRTMFISRLNSSYTWLDKDNATAELGVDYVRLFPGGLREAPAIFKYDGKYYMFTSGATGWTANAGRVWVADDILGEWTDLGDPFIASAGDPGPASTGAVAALRSFGSQSTAVIPVDAAAGKFIYMGDRWGSGGSVNSSYVWLPVTLTPSGGVEVHRASDWNLSQLDGRNTMRVTTPLDYYYFDVADLPTTVSVEVFNGTNWVADSATIDWDTAATRSVVAGLRLMERGTVEGVASVGGDTHTVTAHFVKIDSSARYLIDSGSEGVGGSDLFDDPAYAAKLAELAPSLRNTVSDKSFADDSVDDFWGYTTTLIGTAADSPAMYYGPTTNNEYEFSGFQVPGNGANPTGGAAAVPKIGYRLHVDEPGLYTVAAGVHDWFAPVQKFWHFRVSYTDSSGNVVVQDSPQQTSWSYAAFDYTFPVSQIPVSGTDIVVELVWDGPGVGNKNEAYTILNWLSLGVVADSTQIITATLEESAGALVISVDADDREVILDPFELTSDAASWWTSGALRPVTVTDTRAGAPGWSASGQVSDFASSEGNGFSGAYLGWAPKVLSQPTGLGVEAGPAVAPGFPSGEGLATSRTLASAAPGSGLGTARLGADLELQVDTSIQPGTYRALITFTAL